MIRWRRRREIACRELVELVTAYLDGAMSRADRARFDAHLGECGDCREFLLQLRRTIEALATVGRPP
jgi:predicted anti-sigma-YlaC factor YlaD